MGVVGANGSDAPGIGDEVEGKRLRDSSRRKVAGNKVLQGAGAQPLQTYLDRRQATVEEWVALRRIFDVCSRYMGYE